MLRVIVLPADSRWNPITWCELTRLWESGLGQLSASEQGKMSNVLLLTALFSILSLAH